MSFRVTRSSGVVVKPSDSTPSGILNLSILDRLPQLRVNIPVLFIYRHGKEAARVFKEALSKALVPYYPLAGRLKESSDGVLQLACTGEGAWFMEASANYSLYSVNYFDNIFMNLYTDLLPTPVPESYGIDPLVQFQLTRFTCEGFVLGFTFYHTVLDGIGAAQFLNAIGELARGFLHPTIAPIWHREAIPSPAWLVRALSSTKLPPPPEPSLIYQLEHASIHISLEEINKLKNDFFMFAGSYCSTFDVVVASLWQNRTQAIGLEKHMEVHLVFTANARKLLDPPMPEGYYGNLLHQVTVTSASGLLVEASNAEVVKLIKDAKSSIPTLFNKFIKNNELDDDNNPLACPISYATLCITYWNVAEFNETDYGWGHPIDLLPAHKGFGMMPSAVVGLPSAPKEGIRLMTWCVDKKHLQSLVNIYKQGTLARL